MIPNKHFILHVHHNIKNIEQKVILIYIYIPLNRFALNVKKNWTQKKKTSYYNDNGTHGEG